MSDNAETSRGAADEPGADVEIDVAGQRLGITRTHGHGTTLLLLSDYGADRALLASFCQALSCPTVIFDWPGMHGSQGVSFAAARQRMAARAGLVAGLLDALGLARVNVLGMGWGGLLAQQLARSHAGRVHALVLVATSCGQTMLPGRWRALKRLARIDGLAGLAVDAREAREIFGGRSERDCRDVASVLAGARAPSPAALAGQLYAVAGFSSLLFAQRIKSPALILAGDDDRIVPLANARLLQLLMPHAELSVLYGAGHWLLIERRSEALRRIEAFLALFEER